LNNKQRLAVLVGLGISAIFLWFAFRNLEPGQIIDELGRANLGWLLLGAVNYFLVVAILTFRWWVLARAIQPDVPYRGMYPLVCIGYMGNNVYPFRSGEALRVYLLKRNFGVPIVKGATTALVERIFDGLVMLTFILVSLLFVESVSEDVQQVAMFTAPVFLGALAVFFVLAARPNWLRFIVAGRFPGKIGALIDRIAEDVIGGLEGLRTPLQLLSIIGASYGAWMIEALTYWAVAIAFGIEVGYPVILLVVGTANLAGLIPASPGQIGVFEFFASAVLIGVGIGEAQALTYAITTHIVIWLPVTVAGFLFLARQGLGWQAITQAQELEDQAAEESAVRRSPMR
jgi:glycosyltransferase 2 family protein